MPCFCNIRATIQLSAGHETSTCYDCAEDQVQICSNDLGILGFIHLVFNGQDSKYIIYTVEID